MAHDTRTRRTGTHRPLLFGLLALSAVPAIAGVVRLVALALGKATLPDFVRLSTHPLPLALHIVSATTFLTLGAFQVAPALRNHPLRRHRVLGAVLMPLGALAAITGMWIAATFPLAENDGAPLQVLRLVVGTAMLAFIARSVVAIRHRDFVAHEAAMMRAYALGAGAGTQLFTMMPYTLVSSLHTEAGRVLFMAAGWGINIVVAERALDRLRPTQAPSPTLPSATRRLFQSR